MVTEDCDYVVVGAGSSGCVIANRLVNAGKQVLLLESGPADNDKFIHIPATFVRVIGTERSWVYESEPQPSAANRAMYVPQGRTLGGGSSLNAMVYIRGQAEDYDEWSEMGCDGWAWQDVLPVFRRCEANTRLFNSYHGNDGPLSVTDIRYRHPLSRGFVAAAQEAGLSYNPDFNSGRQAGVGFYQTTTRRGRRGSTAVTYLRPVMSNPNLKVITEAHVSRVILENGAAVGIAYRTADGAENTVRVRHEVILSSGALATPKLLMLSGIGPQEDLAKLGIPVIRHLSGVGRNYQDHLEVSVYGRARKPISLLGNDKGIRALRHGAQYFLFRSGLLTSNVVESGGFVDTLGTGRPDVQFHVLPVLVGDVGREPLEGHGISINPCFLRPKSRGTVKLRSRDASAPIIFDPNYLTAQEDVDTLVRGVKLARKILRAPALAALVEKELLPGEADDLETKAIEDHVRQFAKTVYHPAGTCRMGKGDEAVVDPKLRVQGVSRLRVADVSIMPKIVSGNTNAAAVMIGERCADFVLSANP
jgi:choline dehydrogenase-like flavoprotein